MTDDEVARLTNQLVHLFPDWKATPELLAEWKFIFRQYSDCVRVQNAIRELLYDSTYNTPKIKQFRVILQRGSAVEKQPEANEGLITTGLFIQCVNPLEEFVTRAGWFIPLIYSRKNPPPEMYWRKDAGRMTDNHTLWYDGVWQIIDCTNEAEPYHAMTCRQRKLKQEFGIAVVPLVPIPQRQHKEKRLAQPRQAKPWTAPIHGLVGVSKMDAIKQLRATQ